MEESDGKRSRKIRRHSEHFLLTGQFQEDLPVHIGSGLLGQVVLLQPPWNWKDISLTSVDVRTQAPGLRERRRCVLGIRDSLLRGGEAKLCWPCLSS